MHDTSGETDRTVLLQSAILLSFYHSEKDLHTQPWYWSGIAISHCQIMGLHRPPAMTDDQSSTERRQRSLWRRLWWCCFFRDRWLSLTLGRPLRIDLLDCTVVMPVASDLLVDIADMPGALAATYVPEDWSQLAQDWVLLMQVSKLLGEVLALSFRPNARKQLFGEMKALEAAILACPVERGGESRKSSSTVFSWCHIQLHYQYDGPVPRWRWILTFFVAEHYALRSIGRSSKMASPGMSPWMHEKTGRHKCRPNPRPQLSRPMCSSRK
jgi:hypothetical protein